MAGEEAVVIGLAFTAFMFGYYAFELRDSAVESNQRVALLLAFVSLFFTNILFYATYLIAQNNATYLTNGFLQTGLMIMMWTTSILLAYMFFASLWSLFGAFKNFLTNWVKGDKGRGGDRTEKSD